MRPHLDDTAASYTAAMNLGHDGALSEEAMRYRDELREREAAQAVRVRIVVGEADGRRYVLSCLEGDSRFDRPSDRFLTCDRVVADQIVAMRLTAAALDRGRP